MLLYDILVHPDTYEPIEVNWNDQKIAFKDDASYKAGFIQGVPYFLPLQNQPSLTSGIHTDHGTTFDYQNHYEEDAKVFDYFQDFPGRVEQAERNRLNEVIIHSIPDGVTSILDVGCGNGWLAAAMVSDTTSVISLDISSRNPVRALNKNTHPRHHALIADAYHLPLKENSLDCIVASEVMEHVPDPSLFIKKLYSTLKPGGTLILTTPYNERIEYHLCVHCNHPTPSHAHLHSFHERNIKDLIPEEVRSWQYEAFSHKYLSKLRLYKLMNGWPYFIWKFVDVISNKIWRHPMRLLIVIEK